MEIRKTARANLENKRKLFLEIGFIVSLLLVFAAFEYRSYEVGELIPVDRKPDLTIDDFTEITVQKEPERKMPQPVVIKPTDIDIEETPEIPEFDARADNHTENPVDVEYHLADDVPEPEDITIYRVVQSQPSFPGGMSALKKYLSDHIQYPALAKNMGQTGTVYVGFVVEKDGSVSNVRILRSLGYGCDEEAMRVVKNMPPWIPGMQVGKAVRVEFVLPVKYTLIS